MSFNTKHALSHLTVDQINQLTVSDEQPEEDTSHNAVLAYWQQVYQPIRSEE